jgi:tungstate transport system ATP-binding protein
MSASILPLELHDVSLEIGGTTLIDRVSAKFSSGPLTLVMGPNGAGKSLLLRLCHGLIQPTSGVIAWHGSPPHWPVHEQAMVFQKPVMLRRSAAANVAYPLKLRGMTRAERDRRVQDALERTGLTDVARTPAYVLSGGQQQRLAIARAWVLEPQILFLDEPTASLDPAGTRDVEALITAVHEGGTKVVLTSHRVDQVRRLATEVLFLHKGRLIEAGPADSFLDAPKSAEARAYLAGELLV